MTSIAHPVQLPLPFDEGRTCNTCNTYLPLEAFPRAHTKLPPHIRSHRCRPCQSAYKRQYYLDNRERLLSQQHAHYQSTIEAQRAKAREYARKHRVEANERLKRWRQANPERERALRVRDQTRHAVRIYERNKAWCAAHPERAAASKLKYRRNNPESVVVQAARRRARLRQAGATLTRKQWQEIKERWDYRCLCCGRQEPEIKVTLDHIVPVCKGGGTTPENTQPLCQPCQHKKHTKVIDFRNPDLLYKGMPSNDSLPPPQARPGSVEILPSQQSRPR